MGGAGKYPMFVITSNWIKAYNAGENLERSVATVSTVGTVFPVGTVLYAAVQVLSYQG